MGKCGDLSMILGNSIFHLLKLGCTVKVRGPFPVSSVYKWLSHFVKHTRGRNSSFEASSTFSVVRSLIVLLLSAFICKPRCKPGTQANKCLVVKGFTV